MRGSNSQIISVNLDSKYDNLLRLEEFIRTNQPIICLVQDVPYLKKDRLVETLRTIARHYSIIFNDEHLEQYKKIDNVILIHEERIQLRASYTFNNRSKATSIGVSISRIIDQEDSDQTTENHGYGRLTVFSVYIRPRALHHETKACLDWILNISQNSDGCSRTIVMGDMNASETTWCPIESVLNNKEHSEKHYRQIKLVRGRMIARHFSRMHLTCMNKTELGPSYESSKGQSYIDLAFVGNKAIRTWRKLSLRKLWEPPAHKALVLETGNSNSLRYKRRTYKRIKPELINSSMFEEAHLQCDPLCSNWKHLPRDRIIKRMNRITNVIYRVVRTAQLKVTVKMTKKLPIKSTDHSKGVLNARVRHQISKLRKGSLKLMRVKRAIKRTHSPGDNAGELTNNLLNKKKILKKKITDLRKSIINSMNANELIGQYGDLSQQDLWDRIHKIQNLLANNGMRASHYAHINDTQIKNTEDIEKLADHKFPYKHRDSLDYVDRAYNTSPASIRVEIYEGEVLAAASDIRNKDYTSAEDIRMNIFYRSLEFIADIVGTLMEMSFWVSHIPEKACITQGTLIPKKTAGQFRIVHVSSPLAALFEIVALRRLEFRLEQLRLNSPYQFGFSALVSRHDLIARLLEFFYKEYLEIGKEAAGVIISLDIEGAFDNVNQDCLIKQLDVELGGDPIKFWLASFILNRRIRIKRESLRSSMRKICMGVPQGSALGPVLWNYMIHNIDRDIAVPGKLELIRYADDIILVYNGKNKDAAQKALNMLIHKLKQLDLNIRPEKCSVMGIRLEGRDRRELTFHVDDKTIAKVDKMNILGVPVTNRLRLDRNSSAHTEKLYNSIKKLHNINRLGLINRAQDWRILIESYIKSRLIVNNWPILILDTQSCKWVDEQIAKAFKLIFGWPSNTSTKLMKLITGTLGCRETVLRTAKLRALTEFRPIYEFLIKICHTNIPRYLTTLSSNERRELSTPRLNLELDIARRRKHPDPTKLMSTIETKSFQDIISASRLTWILLDRNKGSMLAEINESKEVLQIKLGRHCQYPISYFNSFALLWKVVSDPTLTNKSLTLSGTNSLLSALENPHNKDWRVIKLRESIFDAGWIISKIGLGEEKRLRESLARKYSNLSLRHDTNAVISDFNLWLAMNESVPEEKGGSNARPIHKVESLSEPYLWDYRKRNHINKWAPAEDETFFQLCHTTITRALTTRTDIWQLITPNWLDGYKMIVLGGVSSDENGQLVHGERVPSDTCYLCATLQQSRLDTDINQNWRGISDSLIKSNLVLHKTFVCDKFNTERDEFLKHMGLNMATDDSAVDGKEILERMLSNRKLCQKFLSFMVKCNMTER